MSDDAAEAPVADELVEGLRGFGFDEFLDRPKEVATLKVELILRTAGLLLTALSTT